MSHHTVFFVESDTERIIAEIWIRRNGNIVKWRCQRSSKRNFFRWRKWWRRNYWRKMCFWVYRLLQTHSKPNTPLSDIRQTIIPWLESIFTGKTHSTVPNLWCTENIWTSVNAPSGGDLSDFAFFWNNSNLYLFSQLWLIISWILCFTARAGRLQVQVKRWKYFPENVQNDTFYSDPESGWKNAIGKMVHAIWWWRKTEINWRSSRFRRVFKLIS